MARTPPLSQHLEALRQVHHLPQSSIGTLQTSSAESETLVLAIADFAETRQRLTSAEFEKARAQSLSEMAFRVAHDIRSPVSALGVVVHLSTTLEEQHRRLIRMAIERIEGIANDLLGRSHNATEGPGSCRLLPLIENIISEKGLELGEKL